MSTDARKKSMVCPGTGIMATVSRPLWVLGIVLMLSARAAIALNY